MKVLTSEMADWGEVAQTEVARAIPIFEAADDAASLALAYRILVYLHGHAGALWRGGRCLRGRSSLRARRR